MTLLKKHIRSFVKREGRLTAGQLRALEQLWPHYGIDLNKQSVDLAAAFDREAPCVLEIGFGNGETLAQMAVEHPELNFLGIEVHRPGVGHLLQLIDKQQLTNVRVVCHDAVELLHALTRETRFQQVSIFFPDPWPKKRHHKRRLIQPDFVALLATILDSKGILHIATDWSDYADHIREVMNTQAVFKHIALDAALLRPATKFEQRGLGKGHVIADLVYQKSTGTTKIPTSNP
jgi:tRNA (guanine-N7-)-methyltransferase